MPRPSSSPLSLDTLGSLTVLCCGKELPGLGVGKQAALLVYLVLQPGVHRREALADLLWPGTNAESARLNLRQTLFGLRAWLKAHTGLSVIRADRQHLEIDPQVVFETDVAAFLDGLDKSTAFGDELLLARTESALALYAGPFLRGLDLVDCSDFMDWLVVKRESLHQRALDGLLRLIEGYAQSGAVKTALRHAMHYQELEPWGEVGYWWGMRLHAMARRPDAALAMYETYRRVLERNLGMLPGARFQALLDELQLLRPAVSHSALVAPARERRNVTVLFCALRPIGANDPEESSESLSVPYAECERVIQSMGGHAVPLSGGSVLAYFGYPQALENSAWHALRAASRMVKLATPQLEVRVGIHGGVIVTSGDHSRPDSAGDTTNLAIQLHVWARSSEVLISSVIRKRIKNLFRVTGMGSRSLEGGSQAIEVFRLEEAYGLSYKLEATSHRSPLVGRDGVLAELDRLWAQARARKQQSLLLLGEAGMGKSRVVHHFADRVSGGGGTVIELRCFPETRQSPLYPVVLAFQKMVGWDSGDANSVRLLKLESFLRQNAPRLAQRALPWLAHMLDFSGDGLPTLPSLPPGLTNATLFGVLMELLHVVARHNSVLLVLEDAHWADTSTLALVEKLCEANAPLPVCMLLTARPQPNVEKLADRCMVLPALTTDAVISLVQSLRPDMSAAQMADVVAKADGIPLYAEELIEWDALGGVETLPLNLLDLLAVRLQTLGTEGALAQWMACIGQEVDEALLEKVSDMPRDTFRKALGRLLSSGLFLLGADRRVQFKHALLQEAAYQALPRSLRKANHKRIAQVLESNLVERSLLCPPELLAQHWTAAGEAAKAIPLWLTGGRHAAANYAFAESVSHYKRGLELLPHLAEGSERDAMEFSLLVNLAHAEQVLGGYGNASALTLMGRAAALLDAGVGNMRDRFHALWGQWEAAAAFKGHGHAEEVALRLVALAHKADDSILRQQAHYALGSTLFWSGRLGHAREQLQICISMEEPEALYPVRSFYGRPIPAAARGYLSCVLWLQGEEDAAVTMMDTVTQLAECQGQAFDQAFGSAFAALLHRWRGDNDRLAHAAMAGITQAQASQAAVLAAFQTLNLGWAEARCGDLEAVLRCEPTVKIVRQSSFGWVSLILIPYIEMLVWVERYDHALTLAEDVLTLAIHKENKICLPELYRLKGHCLAALGNAGEANESFALGLAEAKVQGRRFGYPSSSL